MDIVRTKGNKGCLNEIGGLVDLLQSSEGLMDIVIDKSMVQLQGRLDVGVSRLDNGRHD